MKVYYDISSPVIAKLSSHVMGPDNQSKWTSFLLVLLVSLQCFCIVHHSWYILHIDLDSCVSCGKMISSFGLILENQPPEVMKQNIPMNDGIFRDVIYENNYTVEGVIHLYVGMWTTRLCLKDHVTCFNPWLAGTKMAFEQTPFIRDILESVFESRPFVLSALIATVVTFLFARFVQISSRSRAVAITILSSTISGILSMLSCVIAGIPYLTSVNHSYIQLSAPWALISTMVAGYVAFVIAYRVKMGTSVHKQVLLRHWSTRHL